MAVCIHSVAQEFNSYNILYRRLDVHIMKTFNIIIILSTPEVTITVFSRRVSA